MQSLRRIFAVIGCAFAISSCGESSAVSNNLNLDSDIIPIESISLEDEEIEEEIVTKTCEEITSGMMGGSLTDLLVGSYIEPNCVYTCSFSHSKTFSGEYTVKSDDRTIAQVTHESGTNSFTIKGITPGDAIIQACSIDENGDPIEVILQFVVHVRKRIALDDVAEALYKVDVFHGMFYGYNLSFISTDPLKGTLLGSDDFEQTYANFTLIDGVEERIGNGTDFNTYKFKISIDSENSSTSRNYTYLYVSTTGDKIYMYYTNGIVDIFTVEEMNIYSGSWDY